MFHLKPRVQQPELKNTDKHIKCVTFHRVATIVSWSLLTRHQGESERSHVGGSSAARSPMLHQSTRSPEIQSRGTSPADGRGPLYAKWNDSLFDQHLSLFILKDLLEAGRLQETGPSSNIAFGSCWCDSEGTSEAPLHMPAPGCLSLERRTAPL